jgi:hypothetical protein
MPQKMADHPVGGSGSLSSCYLVRRPEVDALVNAYVHNIISHVRKPLVRFSNVDGRAEHGECCFIAQDVLERARHRASQVVRA